MTILVDMDDTIECLLSAWVGAVNKRYGRSVKYEDITQWDVSAAYPGLTREEVYGIIEEDDFWDTVEPMPGAAEALEKLINDGHRVYIVTATPYTSVRGKIERVLLRYFPFIPWKDVIITSRKQLISADVLVDDGIHNLSGGSYAKILFTAPHNRDYDAAGNGMYRAGNWEEAVEIIERIDAANRNGAENI